jgi:hypothetical protein
MEVYAGFLEHTDVQVGKLIDELEARGIRDNTLVIYILSDNGASAEGMDGSVAELNAQNGIPSTSPSTSRWLEQLGGLDAIGGPKMDNMYHAAWAWAGDSPFRYTKLIAADWGGTRTPDGHLVAEAHQAGQDAAAAVHPRQRRGAHHLRDPRHRPPKVVDGHEQDPIDGVSFAYTFDSADAPGAEEDPVLRHHGQPRHLPRRLDGQHLRTADAVGGGASRTSPTGTPCRTVGAVRHAQRLLADERPGRRAPREARGAEGAVHGVAEENKVLPIGGALYTGLNPQEMKRSTNTEWTLFEGITRIPESQAPNVRNGNLRAEIEAEVPEGVNGVIFAMGGYAGGVSLFAVDGTLYYEYSALLLKRDKIEVGPLPEGEVTIAFEMRRPWSAPRPPS